MEQKQYGQKYQNVTYCVQTVTQNKHSPNNPPLPKRYPLHICYIQIHQNVNNILKCMIHIFTLYYIKWLVSTYGVYSIQGPPGLGLVKPTRR